MKKIKLVLLTSLVIFCLAACSSVEFNESELLTLAKSQVVDMINNDFESTVDTFSQNMAKELDVAGMKTAWDSAVEPLGEHVEHFSAQGNIKDNYFVVTVMEEYQKGKITITISYNEKGEIEGIYLTHDITGESTDESTEESTGENVVSPEEKLLTLAKSQVADMVNNNFESTVDTFSSTVAQQLDIASMETAWNDTTAQLGEHVAHYSVEGITVENLFVVTVIEEYENRGLEVTISYNDKNEIDGIYLNYTTINSLVSNDFFGEHALTIGDTYPLDGVLTLPKSVQNPPVVLLVQGSGSTDKNATINSNTPFRDIAHALAKEGIATFRYDKRFYTYPELATELGSSLNLENEVLDDVGYALEMLLKESRIDTSNIYVLGHSLGGSLTPYIAYEHKEVKGIISMAGSLRPLYEISYDQNKAIEKLALSGAYDEETKNLILSQMEQVELDIEVLRGDLSNIPNDKILLGIHAGYQKSVKEYAGENYINNIDTPILVLQGAEDFQVFADTDFELFKDALTGNENATLKLYENLNHLMMTSNGKTDLSEYQIKGVVHQDVIDDIVSFVK